MGVRYTAMGLHFLVDWLLLSAANRLSGYPQGGKRCAGAALIGALYGAGCMTREFFFLNNGFWRGVSLGIMSWTAFGISGKGIQRGCLYVLLRMTLDGIAIRYDRGEYIPLLMGSAALWVLCGMGFENRGETNAYIPVTITLGENSASVLALRDTGNTLRDPLSGEQVLIVSAGVAEKLTSLTAVELKNPTQTMTSRPIPGLRLIPYRTIHGTGMLLAMRIKDVQVGEKRKSAVVAFAPEGFGMGEVYQALTGGTI